MKFLSVCFCTISLIFLMSVNNLYAAGSSGVRANKTVFLGVTPAGIHVPTIIAKPMGGGFYLGDSGLIGYETASASDNQDDGDSTSTVTFTNQGIYARWFTGNSFNLLFAVHNRTFEADVTVVDPDTSYSATADLKAEATVGTIGIGNQWSFDWGLVIGADWAFASGLINSSSSVDIRSHTYADPADATKELEKFAEFLNLLSASPGFVNLTLGFAF
ncbi:MAG: hypothetical protein GY786_00210 [Proteobacteria bacterium]|nr:hypothetical protein [Pseudomonadota bacterium]